MKVHHGMNRAELDRVIVELGGQVLFLRRTGDVQYRHSILPERPKANSRRKGAPRSLTAFVLRVIRSMRELEAANAPHFSGAEKEKEHG